MSDEADGDEAATDGDEAATDGDEAATDGGDEVLRASDIGGEGPPIDEKPYKIVFEANKCFGAGKCAEVADNWVMDVVSGIAKPEAYYIGEDDLEENVRAADACPAKKDAGVIHVVDRRTDEEIAPDPHGDGTLSVDW
ncbi:MAG: ferredoxin [Halorubrum sp.]